MPPVVGLKRSKIGPHLLVHHNYASNNCNTWHTTLNLVSLEESLKTFLKILICPPAAAMTN